MDVNPTLYSFLKTLFYLFAMPVSLSLELLLAGILFSRFERIKKAGKISVAGSALLLFVFSTGIVPGALLGWLEYRHPPLTDAEIAAVYPDVRTVVVLGGDAAFSSDVPVTSQISPASLARIAEGVRLYRKIEERFYKQARLVVSGGGTAPVTVAELMKTFAREFGVNDKNIVVEKASFITADEARLLKPALGNARFFLVTSAGHMPRSMALFKKAGMRPVAAPTDHWTQKSARVTLGALVPSADNLRKSELAFYEYLGILKEKISGGI